jgi:Big-like domain-containing protein/cadherin domain-containing protein/hemolysin type calcium-binding protein
MARPNTTSRRVATGTRRRALLAFVVLLVSLVAAPQFATARPTDAVAARACTITGTAGPNRLGGTAHRDVLCGLGGADKLRGNGGADVVRGGGGADLLQGKKGADRLDGGSGDDKAFGGAGADNLRGGPGDDGLGGGFGPDALSGGPGRDIALYGQRGRPVRVTIGKGANDGVAGEHDNVHGDVEDVRGGRGNDVLTGSRAANELFGGGGRDRLRGKGGSDLLDGGDGNDRIDAREPAGATGSAAQAGSVDRVVCGSGEDTALVDPEDVVESGCEHVVGGATPPSNHAPTGLTLSNASVAENEPVGTTVGTLSASDPDPGDTPSFALVPGAGSTDNGSFQIVGSQLRTAAVFNYEAKHTYTVRIRATDHGTPAGQIVRAFTITVTDTAEPPVADAKSETTPEDTPVTITLSAADPDGDDVTQFVTSAASHGTPGAVGAIACSGTPKVCTADVSFTPDLNYNGPAGFSYTASDGTHVSAPATVSITVDPVNDTPTATPGSRTTDEDTDLPLDLGALVGDVETSDANLTYEIVTPPAHGMATATTYTPDANFNGTDSLTYKVTDRGDPDNCSTAPCDAPETSTTETVTITVDPVNDTPVALDGNRTTDEDTPVALDLASLASDVETSDANLTYTIVTHAAHGTATATTYTPDADFNGTDTLTYQVTDRGDPDNCSAAPCDAPKTSTTQTVSITVNAVNDAPVNTVPAGPVVAPLNADQPITGISIADVDAAADGVQLTLSVTNGTLTVSTLVPGGIGALDPVTGNGTNTVTVTASLAKINTTLADPNGLVFNGAVSGPDPVTVHTDDLGHNGSGGAETDTDTIPLIVDSPPVAAAQSVTTNEDTPTTITLSATDADGDALTFAVGSGPTHGSLGPVGAPACAANTCTADVQYTPGANYNGPDSFTFTAADPFVTSSPATVSITVDPVDDVPSLANTEAGALAYTENDPATLVTGTTTVTDIDSANFDTGTLTVDFSVGGTADDRLEILAQGQIATSGSNVTHGGTTIGTFTGGTGTTPLVVTLNASATPAVTQDLVRAVAYSNVSDAPSTAARTLRFVLTDGDGGTSGPATRAVTVTAVDDPPVLAGIEPSPLAYTENDPPTAVTATLTVTDPDSNVAGATISISNNFAAAQDVLGFVDQLGIMGAYNAGTGVLTLTGSASPANYQTALRAVRYSNSSENPSALTRTVTFAVQGAASPATRDVTVTPVNDAPVADDESFSAADSAVGNTALVGNDPTDGPPAQTGPEKTITADILAGDTDAEGQTLVVMPESKATNDLGHVTIEADGDFVYTPAPATSCTDHSDFFDYTVSDQNATGPGPTPGTDTGRVTIAITGCVWYVNNNAAGNSGTSDAPFDALASAEAVSGANDTVFVFDGDNTSTGYGGDGYTMNAGERLIGEHEGLVVGADTLLPPNPGAKPTLTATGADVIDLNSGNEVRGFVIDPQGTAGGIAGGTGDAGGTIDDVDITDTGTAGTQAGLELNGTTGTFTITNLTVSNSATGVLLLNAGTADFGTTTITTAGAKGLDATGTNMSTSTFDGITVTGSGTGGVSLTNTTGSTAFGNLALTTTGGTGFLLSNAGTVSVPAGGTDNLSATGGPAVDVQATSGATLAFDDVDSTNSSGDGINLDNAGAFSAATGDIGGYSGIGFDLNGGSGTISYGGNLNNGSGLTAVEVTGRSGGAVTLSGPIADTNDAGGGIALSGNTGGSTTFSNASKLLNTTTSDAVSFTGSDGHTLNLTGGGLNVDTTSGQGIVASGSGTLVVSGTGNTIDTTTGRALNVSNTDIGAADATFERISSNGAPNGILLNTTGAAGNLVVTGNGGTCALANTGGCTGGEIRNSAGADDSSTTPAGTGIVLKDTASPSLTRMWLHDHSNYAIRGTNVAGFTLADSVINGTNGTNATTPFDDSSVWFDNLTGSASVTSTAVSGGFEDNFRVVNTTGSLNRITFTSDTIGLNSTSDGNDGVLLETSSAAGQLHATVDTSTFTGARGDLLQFNHDGSGTGDLVLTGNSFSNSHPAIGTGGGGLSLFTGGGGSATTMNISGNTFRDAVGTGVLAVKTVGSRTLSGTFTNNTIGVAGATNSGSAEGSALELQLVDQGTSNWTVTNNQIRGYNNNGITVLAGGGSTPQTGTLNTTITGNTITQPGNTGGTITIPKQGVHFNIGTVPGDTFLACAAITGNTLSTSGADSVPSTIDVDVRLRQRQSTAIRLPGYVGAVDNTAAVQSFVAANNDAGTSVLASVSSPPGGGFTGGAPATCP